MTELVIYSSKEFNIFTPYVHRLYGNLYNIQLRIVPVIHLGRWVPGMGHKVQTLTLLAVVSIRISDKQFAVVACVSTVCIEENNYKSKLYCQY